MTLNEFLSKAGQLIGLAEKNLTAEASLASVQAENTKLQGELTAATAGLTAAQADLLTAKQTIGTLTEQNKTLAGQVSDLTAKIEAKGKEVEAIASKKALEIVQGQGAPPVDSKPSADANKTPDAKTELTGFAKAQAAFAAQLNKK